MKMYKVYSGKITEVEVSRATEKSVFLQTNGGDRKEARNATYMSYHNTWEDARTFMAMEASVRADMHKKKADEALDEWRSIVSMKNPEESKQ